MKQTLGLPTYFANNPINPYNENLWTMGITKHQTGTNDSNSTNHSQILKCKISGQQTRPYNSE